MGIVEEVGKEVRTVKKGDWVLAPFAFSDGKCEFCEKGPFHKLCGSRILGGSPKRDRSNRKTRMELEFGYNKFEAGGRKAVDSKQIGRILNHESFRAKQSATRAWQKTTRQR